jgi:hypothetical protein
MTVKTTQYRKSCESLFAGGNWLQLIATLLLEQPASVHLDLTAVHTTCLWCTKISMLGNMLSFAFSLSEASTSCRHERLFT